MMQDLVGIVRRSDEMERALEALEVLRTRAQAVSVSGNREYNPAWHTALDLTNLFTVSEAIIRSALARRESRGGHFRDDFPEKDSAFGSSNHVVRQGEGGGETMHVEAQGIPPIRDDLAKLIKDYQ